MSLTLPRWFGNPPPSAAVEISARRVTVAVIAQHGSTRVLSGYAGETLPPGAVEPALNAPNIHDLGALTSAIGSALDKLPARPKRIALVLPDSVGKLSLLRFEKIPEKMQDLDQLIRWQVRKSAPFKIEDAQVAWVPGIALPGGGREYVVTVRAAQSADWLLVHLAADYSTLAVVRGGDVIFFRTRPSERDEDLADLVHQTAMYHEDRLGGGGFSRVVLAGASSRGAEPAERLRRELEARIGTRVQALDFRGAVALRDRIAAAPELLDSLAPAIGVILREQVA